MKTFSMSQAGANIAFPFSVNAPFSVKAIQIDNVTTATIIVGTKAFTLVEGGDITIVPPYSARAVLVQDIGTIWISSNGSITFSSDRLGITLYDSEVQPFVSAYALANGPMIIANQTLFQQGIALGEIAAPVNPAASTVDLYAKVDGHLYILPAGDIEHQLLDDSSALTPPGIIWAYAGGVAPTGWLLCYGQSLLRSDYTALFAVISTTYGSADGTHFSLPDLRGRVALGADNMGGTSANRVAATTADNLGQGAGLDAVTLSIAQMPSHAHTLNNSKDVTPGPNGLPMTTLNNITPPAGSNTQSTGGGGAHDNMPPYLTLNYIIKV